jgi:hypothetical protein
VRRYVWELMYTADQYVDLLNTFSGHIGMIAEKRDYLYPNVRERSNARVDPAGAATLAGDPQYGAEVLSPAIDHIPPGVNGCGPP